MAIPVNGRGRWEGVFALDVSPDDNNLSYSVATLRAERWPAFVRLYLHTRDAQDCHLRARLSRSGFKVLASSNRRDWQI